MNIDKLRNDHNEILAQVNDLRELVQAGVVENAAAISRLIVSMSSGIKLHLSAEDRVLYPAYLNSKDPSISKVGQTFQKEMGSIAPAYLEFVAKWSLPSRVAADPLSFKEDANNIFKALHQRIQRENQELYPLADRL